jgi:hypothetical protein
MQGPVKVLNRCQAKAETDYRFEKFPTSAHVLDINRCALIFDDISSCLLAMKLCEQAIYNQEAGCIIGIARYKNSFDEYIMDDPGYADVKFNVIIKGLVNTLFLCCKKTMLPFFCCILFNNLCFNIFNVNEYPRLRVEH